MPFLHRLACFRDDLVFLVFLYQVRYDQSASYVLDGILKLVSGYLQRWIYRIDPERVNEYGQVLNDDAIKVDASGESKKEK